MPVFMPKPPEGGKRCAASPTRKALLWSMPAPDGLGAVPLGAELLYLAATWACMTQLLMDMIFSGNEEPLGALPIAAVITFCTTSSVKS